MSLSDLSAREKLILNDEILELLPVGLLIFDFNGALKVYNKALENITGYQKEDSQLHLKILEKLDRHLELQEIKIYDSTKDGKDIVLLAKVNKISFEQPDPLILTIVQDITDLQELEKAVLQVERLAVLGQLAAGCAHEIRNPLTAIKGFIQLLRNHLSGSPKEAYIEILMSEIERINLIVDEFLNLGKPARMKKTVHSYEQIVLEMKRLFESEAVIKRIETEYRIEKNLPLIKADKEQIKQVLINITKNSFDAMPAGGKFSIEVSYQRDNNIIRTIFKDTGEGIKKEDLPNIFDAFYTTKRGGTGLGLVVSKQILKKNGGMINIESEPGKGTVVTIDLPGYI